MTLSSHFRGIVQWKNQLFWFIYGAYHFDLIKPSPAPPKDNVITEQKRQHINEFPQGFLLVPVSQAVNK